MKAMFQWLARRFGYQVVANWRVPHHAQSEYLKTLFQELDVDCVIDVGANEGQYRDFLRLHVGYRGLIVSFEPIPHCVSLLRERAAADRNWHIEPVALGSTDGTATLNVMVGSTFSSLLAPSSEAPARFSSWNKVAERVTVDVRTLREVIPWIRSTYGARRIYLKLDTQGYDLEVVRGAGAAVEHVEAMQTELPFTPLYVGAVDWHAALRELQSHGFELSGLFPNNPHHFPNLYEVDCHLIHRRWSNAPPPSAP